MSNPEATKAHLIFLKSEQVLLSKQSAATWRDLQNLYEDYMTSLGPWTEDEVCDYFEQDYGAQDEAWPFSRKQLTEFFRTNVEVIGAA